MIEVVHVYRDALFDAFPPEELPEGYVGSTVYPLMNDDGGENREGEDGEPEGDRENAAQQDDDNQQDAVQRANDDPLNRDGQQGDTQEGDTQEGDTKHDTIQPNTTQSNTTTPLSQHDLDEQLTRLCLLVTPLSLSHTVPQRRLAVRTPPPGLQLPLQISRRPRPRRPAASQRIL